MNYPKYSVLMSVYYKERAEYLDIALNSMIQQTISPDEFILVEDGPLTKELDKVIKKYQEKYPKLFTIIKIENNGGLGPALAIGVKASKNELIARMDSDDYSIKNRCEKELNCFMNDPKLQVVGSFEAEFINTINNVVSVHKVPEKSKDIKEFMKRRCALLHPTVMYRKNAVLKVGNYHSVPLYEDYDLFARMVLGYGMKAYNLQENLYYIRTSQDFYMRRGGFKYAKTALQFKANLLKEGYTSLSDFIISGVGQALVSIMPNKLRKKFYEKVLRK